MLSTSIIKTSNKNLPDNVHKNIAEYIPNITVNAEIIMYQFTSCKKGIHTYDYIKSCDKCKSFGNIFVYLKKNGNKFVFTKYINQISKIICNNNHPLTQNYSYWPNIDTAEDTVITMQDLFGTINKGNITHDKDFHSTGTVNELKLYEDKYIITGLPFALFLNFVQELKLTNYVIHERKHDYTINSTSWYFPITGKINMKDDLCSINKIYEKYTHPQKLLKK